MRKQRSLWQKASLSQDRVQILSALGFELGSDAQITEEWEFRFDQLQECLLQMVISSSLSHGKLAHLSRQRNIKTHCISFLSVECRIANTKAEVEVDYLSEG